MATIKSYTDTNQSKKLADILPLDSADMKIMPFTEREYRIVPINDISVCDREDEIYAWSLAALLGALPSGYVIVKNYHSFYYVESRDHSKTTNIFDNPIDACVAMIIELHELNLL